MRWVAASFPDFDSSAKFYVDFPSSDLIHATAGFQTIANKHGAYMSTAASRSLGDVGRCKRRTLTLLLPPGFNEEDADLI